MEQQSYTPAPVALESRCFLTLSCQLGIPLPRYQVDGAVASKARLVEGARKGALPLSHPPVWMQTVPGLTTHLESSHVPSALNCSAVGLQRRWVLVGSGSAQDEEVDEPTDHHRSMEGLGLPITCCANPKHRSLACCVATLCFCSERGRNPVHTLAVSKICHLDSHSPSSMSHCCLEMRAGAWRHFSPF